jgi:hypothetical protein
VSDFRLWNPVAVSSFCVLHEEPSVTGTFLHEDHPIAPDEVGDALPCPGCSTTMGLTAVHTKFGDNQIDGKYKYEYKNCGACE